jgi:glutathione synthase/RimK-type ligase-like ATP-grasp enzyme
VKSVSILILSEQLDYHGVAVRWGLDRLGCEVHWWERSLFPAGQELTVAISDAEEFDLRLQQPDIQRSYATDCTFTVQKQEVSLLPGRYKAIWNRRGQVPRLAPDLDETDRVVARTESNFLLKALFGVLETRNQDALVVNRPFAVDRVNPKMFQLFVARQVGFRIPNTICSNDPKQVREFFRHVDADMIAKQHIPYAWRMKSGAIAFTGTSRVMADQLRSDFSISASPLTYQEHIKMQCELRVIVFGRSVFAIEQRRNATQVGNFADVRWEKLEAVNYAVDDHLKGLLFEYMGVMGLGYAAFDVAMTPAGEYVFLESNECGQFLYLEECDPAIPILDAFCKYLASGDPYFEYDSSQSATITLKGFDLSPDATTFDRERIAFEKKSSKLSPFELQE